MVFPLKKAIGWLIGLMACKMIGQTLGPCLISDTSLNIVNLVVKD